MNRSILIVCYVFPPYPGIGGRRWAKFAKNLARKDLNVHVVCASNPFPNESLYNNDIKENGIFTHTLPPLYPKELLQVPKTLTQKIAYKIWSNLLKYFTDGTPYDKAIFWKKSMLNKCKELIEMHSIQTIIVSGAPFRICFYSMELKKQYPNLQIITDFRDPWTWGHGYGFYTLSSRKLAAEKKMEKLVIEKSDIITVPVDIMLEYLKKAYPSHANKVIKLPHAFDKDEAVITDKKLGNKKKLLLYGTLYEGIGAELSSISKILEKSDSQLTIISSSRLYSDIFKANQTLNKNVFYQDPLDPRILFNEFNKFDFILIIHFPEIKDYISTKFYEIVYSKRPIIYIGQEGKTSDFIKKNEVGIHILPHDIKRLLPDILSLLEIQFPKMQFNIDDFSFNRQTDFLISLFK